MIFTAKGNQIYFSGNPNEEMRLKKILTIVEDDSTVFFKKKYNPYYDGKVRFYSCNSKGCWFYWGLFPYIEDRFNYKLIGFEKPIIPKNEDYSSKMRWYQVEAIEAFVNRDLKNYRGGIIKMPPRTGKTFVAAELIRKYEVPSLFVVDGVDLLNQSKGDIEKHIGHPVGIIGNGKFDIKKYNVCTIQTINIVLKGKLTKKQQANKTEEEIKIYKKKLRDKKKQLNEFLNSCDLLIIDEIHEYTSVNYLQKLRSINPKHQVALSATPFKSENQIGTQNIKGFAGGILYEAKKDRLEAEGYLADTSLILLGCSLELKGSFEEIKANLYVSEYRNALIQALISLFIEMGIKAIFMFKSKKHGYLIAENSGIEFICGDTSAKNREKRKQSFLTSKGGGGRETVLLVSEIYKKGITLPEAEVFVNVNGGKELSTTEQKFSRVIGQSEGKSKVLIIDIVDFCKYFSGYSLNRISLYERQGFSEIKYFEEYGTRLEEFIRGYFTGEGDQNS